MALRTGVNASTGKVVSAEQVESAALQGLQKKSTVSTPTEQLGTIQTGTSSVTTPQQSATINQQPDPSVGLGQQPINVDPNKPSIQDQNIARQQNLGGLGGSRRPQQAYSTLDALPETGTTRPRSVMSPRVSASADSQQVLGVDVPTGSSGDNIQARTAAEKSAALQSELDKQRLPGWDRDLKGRIKELDQDVEFKSKFDFATDDLGFDSDFDSDFDLDSDMKSISLDEDVQKTEYGFMTTAETMGKKLRDKGAKDVRVADVAIKAGLIDRSGNINHDALGALMFTVGIENKQNEARKSEQAAKLADEIDSGQVNTGDLVITDKKGKQKGSKELFSVLQTPLDRQELQKNLIPRFMQVWKGLDNTSDPSQKPGTYRPNPNLETDLSKDEQALLTAASMDMLEDMGLVRYTQRKDPTTGRERSGWEPTAAFDNVFSSVNPLIDEYNQKLAVDVSLAPLVDGVPVGHAAAQHQQLTRSDPNVRLGRGDPAIEAMDIAGKTGYAVKEDNLTWEAMSLSMVLSSNRDPILGFYDSPFASDFLLDGQTFLKHMPTQQDIQEGFNAEEAQHKQLVARGSQAIQPLHISDASKASYKSIAEVQNTVAELQQRIDAGDANAERDLADFMKRVIRPARSIQNSVAGQFQKDVMDAARLNGQTFYYPQRAQAGTTRIQVGTQTLNYQASKKARGLVGNPIAYVVRGISRSDFLSGKKPTNRRQIEIEAMIARNFEEGGGGLKVIGIEDPKTGAVVKPSRQSDIRLQSESLRKLVKDNPKVADVAIMVSQMIDSSKGNVGQWASQVSQFMSEEARLGGSRSNLKPSDRPQNFPKMNIPGDPIAMRENMMLLAEYMGLGKFDQTSGQFVPGGKSDHAGFVLDSLKNLGDYLTKPVFESHLTAEPDGIASGLTIQGYQFGDENYLRHGGVLYDGIWTTPNGDIRDMIQKNIQSGIAGGQAIIDQMDFSDGKKQVIADVYKAIHSAGKTKDLHKSATMTVAYSQEPKVAARGSVDNFESAIIGTKLQEEMTALAGRLGMSYDDLISDMVDIEARAVGMSLGTSVQMSEAVFQAGLLAGMVNEPYVYTLTNGHEMYLSGVRYETSEIMEYQTESGHTAQLTTSTPVSDPAVRSESHGEYIKEAGSKVSKQASVLPTQAIDAEIAQRTLIEAKNKLKEPKAGTRNEGDNFFWTGQVFDAFLVDLGSYSTVIDAANNQFNHVNKRADIARQHLEAVALLKKKLQAKAAEKHKMREHFDVTPNGEYSAAFEGFRDMRKRVRKILKSPHLSKLGTTDIEALRKYEQYMAQALKFDNNRGTQMTPKAFMKAMEVYLAATNIEGTLKKIQSQNMKSRAEITRKISQQEFEGRPVRQYG